MSQNRIAKEADEKRNNYISFIQSLVRATKYGEKAVQDLVAKKLSELGGEVEVLELLPINLNPDKEFAADEILEKKKRVNVVGKYTGTGNGRSLMLFAHPDSEQIRDLEKWTHDPFEAAVEGGKMYGWGVADDLLGVATMIGALEVICGANIKLRGDVFLCSTTSKRNARGVTALLDRGYRADAAIYLHPAESGNGLNEIKAFASGIVKFRVRVKGKAPETNEPGQTIFSHLGENPILKTFDIIESLKELDKKRGSTVFNKSLDKAIGRSTNLLISHIEGGNPRTQTRMPMECVIGASLSFPPEENMLQLKKTVEKTIKAVAEQDSWLKENPPKIEWLFGTQAVETSVNHPLYITASEAIKKITGIVPHVNPLHSGSDIRNPILFSDIPTIGMGSLSGDLVQAGGHDEWIDVEDYINAIKVNAEIIAKWCG
jgi:acetylornithine deacetylase